uniref:Pentacotripeptide-repeat region of PRORP domain-containing protein n=1 Tax=Glycine max TaxID=3847 RepID=A0A368UK95_SOYBN
MASSTVVPVPPVPVEGGKPSRGVSIRSRLSKLCQQGQPHLARHLLDTLPRASSAVWNTVIIGFICNHMPLEALHLYAEMKSSPDTPSDCYTFSSTLKACSLTQNLLAGKAIHSHFLRSQSNSRIVYNSLLNMYSVCLPPSTVQSQLDYVLKVFAFMRKRNVVAWNTLISWYVKTHRQLHALRAFATLIKTSITPTPVTFVNVFPAVPDPKTALMFYALLLKFGADYANDVFAVSSAIVMFADLGCLDYARMVFDRCSNKNTEVWNTMIGGYVQNNCPLQGIDVFLRALESEEAVCDEVTFLSVICAVSLLQQIKLAQQLHAFVLKSLAVTPVIVVNAIMVMYSRCNFVDTSLKVFDNMPQRDAVSWNTIISSFVQNGLDEEALMLVCEMEKQKFPIDSVTATALLSAASNIRSSYIGRQTHAYLIRHGIQFEGMESYLIDMYAKSRLVRTSELLFEQNCPSDRDLATWNAMIAGYTQNGLSDKAILILREALVHKVMPNAVTLASILPASLALYDSMLRCGIKPDAVTFVAILSACSYSGLVEEGLHIFESMDKVHQVKPSIEHYCCVADMLGRVGRVVEAYEFVQRLGEDGNAIEIWGSILGACKNHGYFELGKVIAEKLLNMETEKRIAGYHVLLSNIYAEEGEWENVDRVRNQMKEKGLQKEMGCSWVEIAGCVNFFVSRDEKHPQSGEIYYILDKLTMDMKDAGFWNLVTEMHVL